MSIVYSVICSTWDVIALFFSLASLRMRKVTFFSATESVILAFLQYHIVPILLYYDDYAFVIHAIGQANCHMEYGRFLLANLSCLLVSKRMEECCIYHQLSVETPTQML